MRNLTATICLIVAVLLASSGMSCSADFQNRRAAALQGVPQDHKAAVRSHTLAAARLQDAAKQEAEVSLQDDDLDALLKAAEEFTRWSAICEGNGHCFFERTIPVRDGQPDDFLTLQVDLDSPDHPDVLYIVASNRAAESFGVWIGFAPATYAEGGELESVSSYPFRCLEIGCGVALPLATDLKGGGKIVERLSSHSMLWVLYELDGKRTRSLITLQPLRDAISDSGRALGDESKRIRE
jgi:hypothetical protein